VAAGLDHSASPSPRWLRYSVGMSCQTILSFRILSVFILCFAYWTAVPALGREQQSILVNGTKQHVSIPAGYRLELLTTALDGPRMLTFAANGELLIGSRSGNIYRLAPP